MFLRKICLFAIAAVFLAGVARADTFQEAVKSALASAKAKNKADEVTFLTNLLDASASVSGERMRSVTQCPVAGLDGEIGKDADLAKDSLSTFATEVAKKFMPALIAALQSAPAAGIGLFLADGGLAPDPFAVLGEAYAKNKSHYSRAQFRDAARGTLRTRVDAFKTMEVERKAAALACLL
jgi:hypothetical protein